MAGIDNEQMGKSRQAFAEFLHVCRDQTDSEEEVLKVVIRRFNNAKDHFIQSQEFRDLIAKAIVRLKNDPRNPHVHIRQVVEEFKAYKKRKRESGDSDSGCPGQPTNKKSKASGKDRAAPLTDTDATDDDLILTGVCNVPSAAKNNPTNKTHAASQWKENSGNRNEPSSRDRLKLKKLETKTSKEDDKTDGGSVKNERKVAEKKHKPDEKRRRDKSPEIESSRSPSEDEDDTQSSSREQTPAEDEQPKKGSTRQIRMLENLLQQLDRKIRKLEDKEMTLDDMDNENSNYILESKYKEKSRKVWNKLCKLKGRDNSTGRIIETKFHFEGTRHAEINKAIQRFINKEKIFPDFHDIRALIFKCNNKYHLKLGKRAVDSLSREAFTMVGNELQERRRRDFNSGFGSQLADVYSVRRDPALFDKELQKKLEKNKTVAKKNIEDVIQKYSNLQDTQGDFSEDSDESEEASVDGSDDIADTDSIKEDEPASTVAKISKEASDLTKKIAQENIASPSDSSRPSRNNNEATGKSSPSKLMKAYVKLKLEPMEAKDSKDKKEVVCIDLSGEKTPVKQHMPIAGAMTKPMTSKTNSTAQNREPSLAIDRRQSPRLKAAACKAVTLSKINSDVSLIELSDEEQEDRSRVRPKCNVNLVKTLDKPTAITRSGAINQGIKQTRAPNAQSSNAIVPYNKGFNNPRPGGMTGSFNQQKSQKISPMLIKDDVTSRLKIPDSFKARPQSSVPNKVMRNEERVSLSETIDSTGQHTVNRSSVSVASCKQGGDLQIAYYCSLSTNVIVAGNSNAPKGQQGTRNQRTQPNHHQMKSEKKTFMSKHQTSNRAGVVTNVVDQKMQQTVSERRMETHNGNVRVQEASATRRQMTQQRTSYNSRTNSVRRNRSNRVPPGGNTTGDPIVLSDSD